MMSRLFYKTPPIVKEPTKKVKKKEKK